MKTLRFRHLLSALAIAALVLPGAEPADAQSKGTIKIATQSPLSGGQSALGEGIKLGAQLGMEKFKGNLEKKGYKVELVPFDDQAKPDVGVANAKNIISDKDIMVVIGHLNSGVAIPSSEVYKEVGLAMISPANTNEKVTDRGYPNVNRVCGRDVHRERPGRSGHRRRRRRRSPRPGRSAHPRRPAAASARHGAGALDPQRRPGSRGAVGGCRLHRGRLDVPDADQA